MADRISDSRVAEILASRTSRLAAPPTEAGRATTEALAIRVYGETYAIEPHVVHKVLAISRITLLPHAPPHVAGLIVHAGGVLPAFHLGAVLGLPLEALPEVGQVLLVGDGAIELALVVEAVVGVRPVDAAQLSPPPQTLSREVRGLMKGVDVGGVPLLDGEALLASEQLVVDIRLPTRSDGRDAAPRGEA